VLQLSLGVEGGDFSTISPNVSGLVMPYETRKCQRINYKLLNEFGHRSVDLDEHMNNEVSSETGVISPVKNSPIFTTIYLHTEDAMDDIKTEEKKYVGSVLKFEDKSDEEDLEATLAELREETDIRCKDFNCLLTDFNNFLLHLKSFMLISVLCDVCLPEPELPDFVFSSFSSTIFFFFLPLLDAPSVCFSFSNSDFSFFIGSNSCFLLFLFIIISSENYSTTSGAMIKKKKKILKKCS
jgi:hypothetical protein